MSTCNLCGASGLTWHENLHCYVSEITGRRHGYNLCLIKIPRFDTLGTIVCYRRPESIAHDIVSRCVAAGKNPDTAQKRIEGDYIIIR